MDNIEIVTALISEGIHIGHKVTLATILYTRGVLVEISLLSLLFSFTAKILLCYNMIRCAS